MRIAGLKYNDIVDGIGICVSLWTQGCHLHCEDCHNPQTWDFNGGYETNTLKGDIIKAIGANGITRNFSILGGEPLCPENRQLVKEVLNAVKIAYPKIYTFLWTGYYLSDLLILKEKDENLNYILSTVDYIIDGPFEKDKKTYNLWLRGSSNQSVYKLTQDKEYVKIEQEEGVIYREQY